ncbi:MAG TPA: glucokinase [Vicinamibacterales bacterium]
MLLAGDVGGTKTLLGLFSRAPNRPVPVAVETLSTPDYDGLVPMIRDFLRRQPGGEPRIEAACFGVAGPVLDEAATLTNVPWRVDGRAVAVAFGLGRVRLLNDLVAIAHSIPVLQPDELHVLQPGTPNLAGNAALLAAGTGMGQSFLFNDGRHLVPAPSEAGHADFAARTPREWQLVEWLTRRYGRAEVEMVVSGIGLTNLYYFTHGDTPCVPLDTTDPGDLPRVASEKARARTCPHCIEVMELFVSAYGAEAGNLAIRTVATRGLYIGGGIAPKNLDLLSTPAFLGAFHAKGAMEDLARSIPVQVILNPQAGLLGAATVANRM